MGYLNTGAFSKRGGFEQDQISRMLWLGPNASVDMLGRTSVLQGSGPPEEPAGLLVCVPQVVSST